MHTASSFAPAAPACGLPPLRRRWCWHRVALLLAAISLCAWPLAALATSAPKRVLIIHSFGRDIAPFDTVASSFRRELASHAPGPVVFLETSLDAGRAVGSNEENAFAAYLKARFSDPGPDLIVTVGGQAAKFAQQRRGEMFPGVPLLFMGLDHRVAPKRSLLPGDAIVATHLDPLQAFENILRIRPQTRRIAMVLGDSPLEHYWRKIFEEASASLAGRAQFTFYDGLPMAEIEQRIGELPPDAAVLYGVMMVDGAGIPHERLDALSRLRRVSKVPLFSLFGNELGRGVVGGPYLSESQVGAESALLALRSMADGPAAEPTTLTIGMQAPVYDGRELLRWQIDEALLPPGSEVRFRPPSVWQEYRKEIVAVSAVMVAQALLIIALLVQRSRRQRAEEQSRTLGGRLMTAYEDEGRRIARELHDDVTQRLASLSIEMAALTQLDSAQARAAAEESVSGALSRLGRDVHALAYRLHPSVIDDLGLEAALRLECDRLARRSGMTVDLEAEAVDGVSSEAALCLLRVAQEALRNVERHAQAKQVRVGLKRQGDRIELGITDDGCGFDPSAERDRASLGLVSMRERVALLRGRLETRSRPGGGTQVLASVPAEEVS